MSFPFLNEPSGEPTLRELRHVDRHSARILAAHRAGATVSFVAEATIALQGGLLPEATITGMCREAAAINHRFAGDESAVLSANEAMACVLEEFGVHDARGR